jgi:hypothetical protein
MICAAARMELSARPIGRCGAEGDDVRQQHEARPREDQRNRQVAALAQVPDEDARLAELAPDRPEHPIIATCLGRHGPLIADAPDVPDAWGRPGGAALLQRTAGVESRLAARCDSLVRCGRLW